MDRPENAIALFPPPAIQGLILESSELAQLFSQPAPAAFTKKTYLPSVKQIANSKVLAQPLDIWTPRNTRRLNSIPA